MYDDHEVFDVSQPLEFNDDEVLFQSSYGDFPWMIPYLAVPFLIIVSGILFVCAVWFPNGMIMRGINFTPWFAKVIICPGIWLLCGLISVLSIYRRLHPQRVVLTPDGMLLPRGRFTSREVFIQWDNLEATLFATRVKMQDIYEITCIDVDQDVKIRIASLLFRTFDEFATFAYIVGQHIGEDWSIKGFLPGKKRGI